jgi:hypothetical protein
LLLGYATRKLFDQDPWEGMAYYRKPKEPALLVALRKLGKRIQVRLKKPLGKIREWLKKTTAPLTTRIKQTATKVREQAEKKLKKKGKTQQVKK